MSLGASHKSLLCGSETCFCALTLESAVFEKEKITGKVVASGIFLLFSCLPTCGAIQHWCEHPWRCSEEGLGHAEGPKVEGENVKKKK